jgi:thioredoxin-like negative regulator of GroEL
MDAPRLVFFYSASSGRCRRVEGYLAQVLQHRHNHDTFTVVRVSVDERPDLAARFRVEKVPTLCVVEDGRLSKRVADPRGARDLQRELSPWLR